MGRTMRYFKSSEFDCPCCKRNEMKDKFLLRLDVARDNAGIPFKVNSGFRCEKHNKEVGGKPNSSHLLGLAADISTPDSRTRFYVIGGLLSAGIERIGIGKDFVHADYDESKPAGVVWLY